MATKAHEPITPGEILSEDFLKPLGISQYRIAKAIGVSPTRIGEIIHGKRRITPDTALKLSKALGLSERYWLNVQADYEVALEKETRREELERIVPLTA